MDVNIDCFSYRASETEEVIEVAIEMTLDEWKALQEQSRPKVELNIRKADTPMPSKAMVIHKSKFLQVRSLTLGAKFIGCCSAFVIAVFFCFFFPRNNKMALMRMWFSVARPMTLPVNWRSTLAAWLGPLVVGEVDEVVVAVGLPPWHPKDLHNLNL